MMMAISGMCQKRKLEVSVYFWQHQVCRNRWPVALAVEGF